MNICIYIYLICFFFVRAASHCKRARKKARVEQQDAEHSGRGARGQAGRVWMEDDSPAQLGLQSLNRGPGLCLDFTNQACV